MKKFDKIISCVAIVAALVSCNSVSDDKADIDARYAISEMPAVTITNVKGESSSAVVTGVLSDPSKVVEVGVRVSESEDMADAAFWNAEEVAAEFAVVAKRLAPLSTYYVQAYVITNDNQTVLSTVQMVETGSPVFSVAQLDGRTYAGTISDGVDSYDLAITLHVDEEDSTKVTVLNLDPYFAAFGYVADLGYNIFEGVIDWTNKVITIEQGQLVGYGNVFIFGLDEAGEDYDDIYLDIQNYGETIVIRNMYGVGDEDEPWMIYEPGGTLSAQ